MDYCVKELREKVDKYFAGDISKKELGEWAECAYYDLLKGGYLESKKIVLYPFLKVISKIHIESNDIEDKFPCSEEDVRTIQSILHGDRELDFQIEIGIPFQANSMFDDKGNANPEKQELFSKMREEICTYLKTESEPIMNANLYSVFLQNAKNKNETIYEILEEHIVKMCKSMFEMKSNGVTRISRMRLYVPKAIPDTALEKLLNYLDCYTGNKSFHILVSYKNGLSEMFLLV